MVQRKVLSTFGLAHDKAQINGFKDSKLLSKRPSFSKQEKQKISLESKPVLTNEVILLIYQKLILVIQH